MKVALHEGRMIQGWWMPEAIEIWRGDERFLTVQVSLMQGDKHVTIWDDEEHNPVLTFQIKAEK